MNRRAALSIIGLGLKSAYAAGRGVADVLAYGAKYECALASVGGGNKVQESAAHFTRKEKAQDEGLRCLL